MRSTSRSTRTALAVFSIFAAASLGLVGCSSGGAAAESEAPAMSDEAMPSDEAMDEMDPAADLVGAGCAAYAEQVPDGAGSVDMPSTEPAPSRPPRRTTRCSPP